MILYIQIDESGNPINHPALESNLNQVFGGVPADWEQFVRIEPPRPDVYEVVDPQPVYSKIDGVWTDVWSIRPMTDEEKAAKQQAAKDAWAARPQSENWSAWTFDETICNYVPPIPRPDPVEGKDIRWCGAENNWKEVPPRPDGQYKFDFLAWQWVKGGK